MTLLGSVQTTSLLVVLISVPLFRPGIAAIMAALGHIAKRCGRCNWCRITRRSGAVFPAVNGEGFKMGSWAREADNRQPPRIPQEVPLGGTVHRLPLRDDATLPRSFGSWSPSFLSIPNSLPLRIQIAGANLLHVGSYTPPATQLPPRCAFPANRPGQ